MYAFVSSGSKIILRIWLVNQQNAVIVAVPGTAKSGDQITAIEVSDMLKDYLRQETMKATPFYTWLVCIRSCVLRL